MDVFRNRYRRAKLAVHKAVGAAPPVDAFGAVDDGVSVSNALARLTPKQRACSATRPRRPPARSGSVARRSARVVEAAPVLGSSSRP
jgi:hypothetical protein